MEGFQRKKGYARKAFVSRVIVLISKRKRDEERKRSELQKAMKDSSIERLAAVISSAKLEFGDQLKDVCEDAESILKELLKERIMFPSALQGSNQQQQVQERKTLRERLLASDDEANSPEFFHQDLQTMRSTSVDVETNIEAVIKLPAVAMHDGTRCHTNRFSLPQNFLKSLQKSTDQVSDGSSTISLANNAIQGISPHTEEDTTENCSAQESSEPFENFYTQPRLSLGALLWQDQGDGDACERDSLPLPFTMDTPSINHSNYHSFGSGVGQNSVCFGSPTHSLDFASSHNISGDAGGIDNQEVSEFEPENLEVNNSRYRSLESHDHTQESPSISENDPPAQSRYREIFRSQSLPINNTITPPRVSLLTLLQQSDGDGGSFIIMDPDRCTSTFFHYWSEGDDSQSGEEIADLDSLCCVCMLARKGAAFIPCGHTFCRKCSQKLLMARGTCPLCNKEIREYLNIY